MSHQSCFMKFILNMFNVFLTAVVISISIIGNSIEAMAGDSHSVQTIDRIVAIVNDGIVTESQLKLAIDRYKHQMAMINPQIHSLTDAQISQKAVQQLIDQQLILEIAKQQSIQASPKDIDQAIARLAALNHLPISQLNNELKKEGITMSQFRQDLSNQIVIDRVKAQMLSGKITISASDIVKYKQQNQVMLQKNNVYHVLDFVIPFTDSPSLVQNKQINLQAERLIHQLKQGTNVDTVGVQYDDLGWRNFNQLPDIFVKPVSGLAANGISVPIQAPNGIHVLKVVAIQTRGPQLTAEQIKHLVWEQKANEELQKATRKMRKTAYIKIIH